MGTGRKLGGGCTGGWIRVVVTGLIFPRGGGIECTMPVRTIIQAGRTRNQANTHCSSFEKKEGNQIVGSQN